MRFVYDLGIWAIAVYDGWYVFSRPDHGLTPVASCWSLLRSLGLYSNLILQTGRPSGAKIICSSRDLIHNTFCKCEKQP